MSEQFDVVALGEAMVEFNQANASEPLYRQGFGGDTSNAVIAASRQGARVAYLSRVGEDHFGRMLLDLWQAEGVDVSAVARDPQAPTGLYFVNHGPRGHSFSYLRAGSAASRMQPQTMDLSAAGRTRWLHVSGISQAISASACDTVFAAIETARAANGKVSFDPNLRLSLWPLARARATICATIAMTDLFLPSLDEAVALAGTDDVPAIFAWARAHGAHTVVLKSGPAGAWYAEQGAQPQLAAARAVQAVDATGAGDCFDGSLLARLAAGDTLADAVRYANAAAGLSTLGHGAVAPIPTAAQVRAALG
ncbi:sugar kinase [Duganella sp. FT109W]|uniref:Sugar kinase n=1 Tax=Duganella margarita TaxID=2692170 RepID=A0ABW9WFS1_9BURK|nr:sugar kinase [Duganella margarita]MYN39095.1 sugar kinase [Duganella margarita]